MKNGSKILELDQIRTSVRDSYSKIAVTNGSCCAPGSCGGVAGSQATALGYTAEDTATVPDGSNLGLGCGNPVALASLQPGETVVDLGSGAGFYCFLAAKKVGSTGRVIGVDMTPEMISKARKNAVTGYYANVEFRLGEIEHLPVPNNTADIIISNCVINLSPDKRSVIREMHRVLKPGGRVAISDIVATQPLPEHIRNDLALHSGCMAGATPIDELKRELSEAGFVDVTITEKAGSREFIRDWAPEKGVEAFITSATIEARKP
ncbi:MAG: arsenite methyltransferase [Limisphaerales bacterium]